MDQRFSFINDDKTSKLIFATTVKGPNVLYKMRVKSKTVDGNLNIEEFIDIKGWKAQGNKLSDYKLVSAKLIETEQQHDENDDENDDDDNLGNLQIGDTIELDF